MNELPLDYKISLISAFVAIVTLIATISIGIMQIIQNFKIDRREEARRKDSIYADATKFILKYSSPDYDSEIYLLPLCIVAYKYNPIYPYRREMYREFCSLTEEVQNCILERQEIDIKSSKHNNFYSDMLDLLKSDIKKAYPDDKDLYYEEGKYFQNALLNHGREIIPDIKCEADKYYKDFPFGKSNEMNYDMHITNLLAKEKNNKPIKQLMYETTSMGTPVEGDEIVISHLACYVSYAAIYANNKCEFENKGYINSFNGTLYMEDLFLKALYRIYIVHFEN